MKKSSSHDHPIVLATAGSSTLVSPAQKNSLAAWFSLYLRIEVGIPNGVGRPSPTFKAKKSDLEKFLGYLSGTAGDDHPDGWTKSVSTGFLTWLLTEKSIRTGKPYASTTVDRVLATLKHSAKWIHRQRPFLAGNPMNGIKDTTPKKRSVWKGLEQKRKQEVTRMTSAAEQLTKIQTQANQYPYRNLALLLVGLNSALRPSEILNLDLSQYSGKAFLNVRCKGNQIVERVPLGKNARDAIEQYINAERSDEAGPLFQSKTGRRLTIQKYDRALKLIAAQANSRQPEARHIQVSPHVLRHTALRKLCQEKGIEFAKKRANHVSDRHIWRYIEPGEQEFEEAVECL